MTIKNQYKYRIIKELCPIDLGIIELDQCKSKIISFNKQVDTNNFLIQIQGSAYFRKFKKNVIELVGLESIDINMWNDDGEVTIDDDSFNYIEKNLTFYFNI